LQYATRTVNNTLSYQMFYPTTSLRFSLNGSVVSTNDLLKSIEYKSVGSVTPVDFSFRLNGNESSTYGYGSTYLVSKGDGLDQAQLIAQISSLNGSYTLTYTLPSMADYLLVSSNYPGENQLSYAFRIGSSIAGDSLPFANEGCYNSTQLSSYYACSSDGTLATGLIYKGLASNFEQLCYSNYTHYNNSANYKLSIDATNKPEFVLPVVKGNCDKISSKYYLIASGQLPKNFGDIVLSGVKTILRVALQYPNIRLVGSEVYPPGSYTLCIRKALEDLTYRLVYVSLGSC